MAKNLIYADPQGFAPGGRRFCTTPEMYDPDEMRPTYSMATVAQIFFCRSTPWFRQKIRVEQTKQAKARGETHPNGKPLLQSVEDEFGPIEPPRTPAGHHAWRLYDIERLAHYFASQYVIDGEHLLEIIKMIKLQAKGYGYLA